MLQSLTEGLTLSLFDRYDGARSLHSHFFAYIIEVSLLQHAGPRSVAPSGCGHGQRCEEELSGFSILQWQGSGDRKGMTRGERLRSWWLNWSLMWHLCSCITASTFHFCQMRYIQPFPGQYVSMDPTAVIDVYGLIGTPPLWKEHAALVWRMGPAYMFEDALSPEAVGVIYTQGTAYVGNFLALRNIGELHKMCKNFTGFLQ